MIGTDPLHEMPILDLRIRKAVRRGQAKLMVASERPTTLDGGADEASATRRARPPPSSALWPERSAPTATTPTGPFEKEAGAIAEVLRNAPDQTIIWGERLWRNPGAVEALLACARALEMHQRIGPGLLEVPEESNGRGLREVGCLPGARSPGLEPTEPGTGSAAIKDGLAAHELGAMLLVNADPVRTHPDSDGWRQALAGSFVVAIASFEDESTRLAESRHPGRDLGREGGHGHPPRRPPAAPAPQRPAPRGHDPRLALPGGCRVGAWRRPDGRISGRRLRRALERGALLRLDHLRGDRRHGPALGRQGPGSVVDSGRAAGGGVGGRAVADWRSAADEPDRGSPGVPAAAPSADASGLLLGTYRDLWATDVTKRNPALRFLMPKQKLEVAAKDAEALELANGDAVTVAVNGHSVEATVAIRERMAQGAAFLIEGTDEANGNVLTNGVPQRIEVTKR